MLSPQWGRAGQPFLLVETLTSVQVCVSACAPAHAGLILLLEGRAVIDEAKLDPTSWMTGVGQRAAPEGDASNLFVPSALCHFSQVALAQVEAAALVRVCVHAPMHTLLVSPVCRRGLHLFSSDWLSQESVSGSEQGRAWSLAPTLLVQGLQVESGYLPTQLGDFDTGCPAPCFSPLVTQLPVPGATAGP